MTRSRSDRVCRDAVEHSFYISARSLDAAVKKAKKLHPGWRLREIIEE